MDRFATLIRKLSQIPVFLIAPLIDMPFGADERIPEIPLPGSLALLQDSQPACSRAHYD